MAAPVRLRPLPLFAPKWSKEALLERCKKSERAFERGFRMRAYSDKETSFPDFPSVVVPGASVSEIRTRASWPAFLGVDLSSKKRPGNALVVVRVDPMTGRRFPVEVRFGSWKSNETAEQIGDLDAFYGFQVIMVEDNGYQASIIEWAEATKSSNPWWLKVEATTTTSETKWSEEKGLPVLQVEFKNRGWVFPLHDYEGATRDDPHPRGSWARLDYEIRRHPVASTSDGLMALMFARQGVVLHGGLEYRREEGDVGSLEGISSR